MQVTTGLRFIIRDGKRILQQKVSVISIGPSLVLQLGQVGEGTWKDVTLIEGDEA